MRGQKIEKPGATPIPMHTMPSVIHLELLDLFDLHTEFVIDAPRIAFLLSPLLLFLIPWPSPASFISAAVSGECIQRRALFTGPDGSCAESDEMLKNLASVMLAR